MNDTSFIREKIKQKPINRGKLLRRTLITVVMAAVFGLVACVTFLLLEPVISDKLSSGETADQIEQTVPVTFQDNIEDEISPEDMIASDRDYISEAIQGDVSRVQGDVSKVRGDVKDIEEMIKSIQFGIGDYQNLYTELRTMAEEISTSLVTVSGISEDIDLLNNPYEYGAQISGVIVADNGTHLLILVRDRDVTASEEIRVHFSDGKSADAEVKGKDEATGLTVLGVNKRSLDEDTLNTVSPASLGTSRSTTLKGTPVLALGSPIGTSDSFAYGMVTSGARQLYMTDADYTLITTDILGTENSSGVLVNLRGNIIGLIDNSYESGAAEGVLEALGISELKPLIESLSNGTPRVYLGIKGMDITYSMMTDYDLPEGIYIREVELDSPAMEAGIQNGDILSEVNGEPVINYHDFILWLSDEKPSETIRMKLLRQSVDEYIEVNCEVVLGERP